MSGIESLKRLLDARWSVRVGRRHDGSYLADAVPCDEDGLEDWDRYLIATDIESPGNALDILAAKVFGLVIDYPS